MKRYCLQLFVDFNEATNETLQLYLKEYLEGNESMFFYIRTFQQMLVDYREFLAFSKHRVLCVHQFLHHLAFLLQKYLFF
jgi:hypothetical protein